MDRDFPRRSLAFSDGMVIQYMEVANGTVPIVWIHGMGSYREVFHPVFKNPPVPGRHIALDLPGFGDSGHYPNRHTMENYAASLLQVLDSLNLAQPILVGHSFGGMVAGQTLMSRPDRIRGVIFVSSAGWFNPEHAMAPTPYFLVNRMGIWITGMGWFGRRMMTALGVNPDQLGKADRRRLQKGWRRAYEMARMGAFYEVPRFTEQVMAAGRPLAAIHGTRDMLFPIGRLQEVLAGRLPLWTIEGAGHVPFYSHPTEFRQAFQEAYAHLAAPQHSGTQ